MASNPKNNVQKILNVCVPGLKVDKNSIKGIWEMPAKMPRRIK